MFKKTYLISLMNYFNPNNFRTVENNPTNGGVEIRFGKVLTQAGSNGSADNNQRVTMYCSLI